MDSATSLLDSKCMPNTIQFQFNTGFEMTIPIEDVEEFCATSNESGDLVWSNAILDDLIHRLEELARLENAGEWDVLRYEDSADGTQNMWSDLRDTGLSLRYAMGVVIFHQMLYRTPLTATKLTGPDGQ